jgi:hypothetical protein
MNSDLFDAKAGLWGTDIKHTFCRRGYLIRAIDSNKLSRQGGVLDPSRHLLFDCLRVPYHRTERILGCFYRSLAIFLSIYTRDTIASRTNSMIVSTNNLSKNMNTLRFEHRSLARTQTLATQLETRGILTRGSALPSF